MPPLCGHDGWSNCFITDTFLFTCLPPLPPPTVCVQFPFLAPLIPRQRKALAAVELIRQTTNDLIKKCKEMVDEEEMAAAAAASAAGGEYLNKGEQPRRWLESTAIDWLVGNRLDQCAAALGHCSKTWQGCNSKR